jgi:hypothetical protein
VAEVIQPRRASAFEPAPATEGPVLAAHADIQEDRSAGEAPLHIPLPISEVAPGTGAVVSTTALEIAAASAATPAPQHHRSAAPSELSEQAPITPAGRSPEPDHEPLHRSPPRFPPLQTRVVQPPPILKEIALPSRWPSAESESAEHAMTHRAAVAQSRRPLLQPVGSPAEPTLRSARLAAPAPRAPNEQPHRARLQPPPAEPHPAPPRQLLTPVTAVVRPQPPLEPPALAPVPEAQSAPTVNVTIGRIEVRAVTPAAPPPKRTAPPAARLALEDYLKQREEGRR